jgi:ribonucleotide reductase alpha subunit/intein/homing endonuclease
MKLKGLSQEILMSRYAYPGDKDWRDRAKAIAKTGASVESDDKKELWEKKFFGVLKDGDFMPGGRIIYGSGRHLQNMLNCYSLVPEDNVASIAKTIADMYKISCGGGGIGFNFSKLRPKGDDIAQVLNSSPGSVSVMKMLNEIGNHVRSGKNRRCLRKGTRVQTSKGFVAIEDVKVGDLVVTKEGFKKVLDHLYQGKQELVRINTQDGYIECTPDHRVAKLTNLSGEYVWVQAQDLEPGDRLIYVRQESEGEFKSLPTFTYINPLHSTTCQDITIPTLDEDMAWFLGLFAGDGYAKAYSGTGYVKVACHSDDIEIIEKATLQLERFGVRVSVRSKKGEKCVEVIANSKQLAIYFNTHIKYPNTSIKIPDFITGNKTNIKLSYISGVMDADGCVKCRPTRVITTVYEEFAKDIKALINSCGIECRFKAKGNPPSRKGWQQLYEVNLINNYSKGAVGEQCSRVGFKQVEKTSRTGYSNGFPSEMFEGVTTPRGWDRNSNQMTVDTYNELIENTKVVPVEVINTEFTSIVDDTYDISVEDEHCFLAEGLLVHNTALIAILDITHPDIIEFLTVKLDQGELINFNISVGVTDRFYEAVENDEDWYFVFNNRRYDLYKVTGQRDDGSLYTVEVPAPNEEDAIRRAMSFHKEAWTDVFTSAEKTPLKARDLWDKIYSNSVESGDPGIYNLDLAKNYTNVSYFESLDNPNPCGEIPLPKYGNCCLGHINLDNMLLETKDGFEPDWKKIAKTVRVGVRFLDNILTANDYPIPECKEVSTKSRRIGLGITGLHYFLLKLGYRYGDESCCEFIERLAQTFRDEAYKASISVAKEKGPFEEFNAKLYLKEGFAQTLPPRIRTDIKKYGIRNAVMLTIAPVGTVSMLLGVSTGVEPIFSAIYKRRYRDGSIWKEQLVIDPLFRKYFEEGKDISNFVGAYDVTPEEHIKVQASLQKYVDSAISKTCNLPETATYEELKDIIFDYAPYVKGFTIYRAGSKGEEPLKAVSIQGLTREEIQAMIDQSVSYGSENEPEEEPVTMCDLTGKGCE